MSRVLIVDENIEHLRTLQEMLEAAGHQVVVEDHGESALVRMRLTPFDVIVLDLVLPGLTGLELLRALRDQNLLNPPPAIVVTSLSASAVGQLAEGPRDAFCVLRKPVTNEQLLEAVQQALAQTTEVRGDIEPPDIEASGPQVVSVTFPSAERFLRDYMDGLVENGLILPPDAHVEPGDEVEVRFVIPSEEEPRRIEMTGVVSRQSIDDSVVVRFADPDRARQSLLSALAGARVDSGQQQIRVHYNAQVRVLRGSVKLVANGLNLSANGVAVAMKVPIDHGRLVTVELPLGEGPPAVLAGKVIWREWDRNTAMWWIGIEFMALPGSVRRRVRSMITQALVECAAGLVDQMERRHVRIPVGSPIAIRARGTKPKGTCVDLCEGGVGVALDEELEVGSTYELVVSLPDGKAPLSERARVTWSAAAPAGGFRHGLAFDDLSPGGENRVRALVSGAA